MLEELNGFTGPGGNAVTAILNSVRSITYDSLIDTGTKNPGGSQPSIKMHKPLRAQCRARVAAAELQLAKNTQQAFETMTDTIERLGVKRLTVFYPNPTDATLQRRRRQRVALNLNDLSNGQCHSNDEGMSPGPGAAVDTYRYPESNVTIHAKIERNGYCEELDLEHRIQLNLLFKAFARRLNELSDASAESTPGAVAQAKDPGNNSQPIAPHSADPLSDHAPLPG